MIELAITGTIAIIIYCVIKVLWVYSPKTLIRWADYFAIEIKEDLTPMFEDVEKEKPIEVLEMEVKK